MLDHDTYDRRIQVGASRRRREDAEHLHNAQRWAGSMYIGGYAIECVLKALICMNECTNNFKDTRAFQQGLTGASMHDLALLRAALPPIERAISMDRTGQYKRAWNTLARLWQKDNLRYWDKQGNEKDSADLLSAVQQLHTFMLSQLGESS